MRIRINFTYTYTYTQTQTQTRTHTHAHAHTHIRTSTPQTRNGAHIPRSQSGQRILYSQSTDGVHWLAVDNTTVDRRTLFPSMVRSPSVTLCPTLDLTLALFTLALRPPRPERVPCSWVPPSTSTDGSMSARRPAPPLVRVVCAAEDEGDDGEHDFEFLLHGQALLRARNFVFGRIPWLVSALARYLTPSHPLGVRRT